MTKAVATHRGWQHSDHDKINEAIREIANEYAEEREAVSRGLTAANVLHGNFYEVFLNQYETELALRDVTALIEILWSLLPDDYTGGASFAEWSEAEE